MTKKLSMGERFQLIKALVTELDDAVSFMETMSEFEDEDGHGRRERKVGTVEAAQEYLSQLTQEYKKAYFDGDEETFDDSYRICSECGSVMHEGYLYEDGLAYYCSDDCLHKHFTQEEWLDLYDDGEGNSYWTVWEV